MAGKFAKKIGKARSSSHVAGLEMLLDNHHHSQFCPFVVHVHVNHINVRTTYWLGAKKLILTHFSNRYDGSNDEDSVSVMDAIERMAVNASGLTGDVRRFTLFDDAQFFDWMWCAFMQVKDR